MFPLRLISRFFVFDDEEVQPEFRAQRILNRGRVPEIARYMVEHPRGYVFSSLTACINGEVKFEPLGNDHNVGTLRIPMSARLLLNDGQHRRAAIIEALKERPGLADETISVVLFVDAGLKRSQQMFSDLNTHAIRVGRSLGILYDHRDPMAELARHLVETVWVFNGLTEMEKTNISNRSRKLFTLSSIYQSTRRLLGKQRGGTVNEEDRALARDFWTEVASHILDWQGAAKREISTAELRRDSIHAHGIALQALAIVGHDLLKTPNSRWKPQLKALRSVDWSRSNAGMWEGRAMIDGHVSKAQNNVVLTANLLKKLLRVPLNADERRAEEMHARAKVVGGGAPGKKSTARQDKA
jgi:DNA sulfur modification protein DndB